MWLEQGLTLLLNGAGLCLYLFLNSLHLWPHSLFLFFIQPLPKPEDTRDSYSHRGERTLQIPSCCDLTLGLRDPRPWHLHPTAKQSQKFSSRHQTVRVELLTSTDSRTPVIPHVAPNSHQRQDIQARSH